MDGAWQNSKQSQERNFVFTRSYIKWVFLSRTVSYQKKCYLINNFADMTIIFFDMFENRWKPVGPTSEPIIARNRNRFNILETQMFGSQKVDLN